MGRLDGKVAVITGAGSGIGRATAILFAKEGAKIVIADWSLPSGTETEKIIRRNGGEAVFVRVDVSKAVDIKKMIGAAIETYGKLDILYNNAGVAENFGPIVNCTEKTFDRHIAINLKGVWLGIKYAIPEMLKASGGSIINTSSYTADRGKAGSSHYSAAKGGVSALTRAIAIEYADKNIRVNSINPGIILTPLNEPFIAKPENREFSLTTIPMRRFGNPEEVAHAALFFASDESSYITGDTLIVDGGREIDSHSTRFSN